MASGPVKQASVAAQRLQTGISGAGQAYTQGVQGCTVNPMQLAAAQADKAITNYSLVMGPMGYWTGKMSGMSIGDWKTPTVAKVSKFTSSAATAAADWQKWYQQKGMAICQQVRDAAAQGRQSGVSSADRMVQAMETFQKSGKKANMTAS